MLDELFPVPPIEELQQYVGSTYVPFPCFGPGGGYGPVRRELVNAIVAGHDTIVTAKYRELIDAGLRDTLAEIEAGEMDPIADDYDGLAENVTPFGEARS